MRHWISVIAWMVLSLTSWGQTVRFSPDGGFFSQAPTVTMTCDMEGTRIFYNTNGQTPDTSDHLYTTPLPLSEEFFPTADIYRMVISPECYIFIPPTEVRKTVVLRAAAFDSTGQRVGDITTHTYMANNLDGDTHGLPVVSICADSADLFDFDTGIMVPGVWFDINNEHRSGNYFQRGREWERMVHVELLLPEGGGFNQNAGLRTHGGSSREYPQKGLKIFAREEYGAKNFSCKVFQDLPYTKYKRLVFKPFRCPWEEGGAQNHITSKLALKLYLDAPDSRPAVLYLNGEYWGIYFIQEKTDERFLETHNGHDDEDYNLIINWQGEPDNGSNANFMALISQIQEADLSEDSTYQAIKSKIDIDEFIDYQIYEIFICNQDWPANNMKCWQYRNGRWRWIFFDGDAALYHYDWDAFDNAVYSGEETWPSSAEATLLFRKLLGNSDFQKKFVNRFNWICNHSLNYNQTLPYWQEIYDMLSPEIDHQCQRFGHPVDRNHWQQSMDKIELFLQKRVEYALREIEEAFPKIPEQISYLGCFPNPTTGVFHVQVEAQMSGTTFIHIYDLAGHLLHTQMTYCTPGINRITLSLHLPAGVYIVRTGNVSTKIVMQ